MKNIARASLMLLAISSFSCKQAPDYQINSVSDQRNTYFFEYDSLLRLKNWESDYNDVLRPSVLTQFVYKDNLIEIFKSEGNHREDGTRYNMSAFELDRIVKVDGWRPTEIVDPHNQQTIFKFFYKGDLISSVVSYYSRGGRDSMVFELDKKGNIVREFLYHPNYRRQYEPRADTVVYEFDNNPNPWYKFIGNVHNGRFLPASSKFNNYSFGFDPSTFFSPNNSTRIKDYKDRIFTYKFNENSLPASISTDDETIIINYQNVNETEPNNPQVKQEGEKLKSENTLDFSVLKSSLLRASINKCKQELGSPDVDGIIKELDDGDVYAWIYLNKRVHSENGNNQHLVVFIKALGHGRGFVEDIQSFNDNEKIYYDFGSLYVEVRNGGNDIQSNSRSFHSTAEKN